MTTTINVYQAKTHLSRLLKRVATGEEIVIARDGAPVARLVPVAATARVLGRDEGTVWIADDAFAPLSDVELSAWLDREPGPRSRAPRRGRSSPGRRQR